MRILLQIIVASFANLDFFSNVAEIKNEKSNDYYVG